MTTVNLGRDIACTTALRTGRYVTGARLVGEAIFRRLTTTRGSLRGGIDEAEYGIDLTALVGSTDARNTAASLSGRIASEVKKDERIDDVDVDVVQAIDTLGVEFTITIRAITGAGPFILVLSASAVTVDMVGLTAEG